MQKAKKNYSYSIENAAGIIYWTKKQLKETKIRYKNMTDEEKLRISKKLLQKMKGL